MRRGVVSSVVSGGETGSFRVLMSVPRFAAVLMADPNWKRGFYYDDLPPHTGMKLARRESAFQVR